MKRFIPALLIVILSFSFAQDAVTTEQIKAQIALLDVRLKNVEQYQLEQRGVPTQLVRIEQQVSGVSNDLSDLKTSLKESNDRTYNTYFAPTIAVIISLIISGFVNSRQKQRTEEIRGEMRDELERIEGHLKKLSKE